MRGHYLWERDYRRRGLSFFDPWWFVKSEFSAIYGLSADYPLPAPDTNADGDPYQ